MNITGTSATSSVDGDGLNQVFWDADDVTWGTVLVGSTITAGGALIYKSNKIKKPINKKSLLSILQNYYKNDPTLANDLTKHIMENRVEQIKEVIKRKINQ